MIAKHLPEPSIDHRSDVRDAPDFEGLTREAYTHLLEDNRRLLKERNAAIRSRDDWKALVGQALDRPIELKMRQPAFDKIAQNATWVIDRDDLCEAVRREAEKQASWLRRGNEAYLAIAIPKVVKVSLSGGRMLNLRAERIECEDGEAVLYEIRVD